MSVDYIFNKKISLNDISEKTSLKVVENNGSNWIVDPFNNHMFIKEKNYVNENGEPVDSKTLELTVYYGNNSTMILDELVKHFNVRFITDNEEIELYYHPELSLDELSNSVMIEHGYRINNDIVFIPDRIEDDYKQYKTSTSTNQTKPTEIDDDISPDELPF